LHDSTGDVFPTSSISMPNTPLGPNVHSMFPLSSEGFHFHLTSQPDEERTPDDTEASQQDPEDPEHPGAFYIVDAKKRQKLYAEYKKRVVNYLNYLGTASGAYGILYLRPYDQSSAVANESGEYKPRDKYMTVSDCVWVTHEISKVPELSTKVIEIFDDYMNTESIVREAQLSSNSTLVVEKRKALAVALQEKQVREKAEAEVERLKARLAEMEQKFAASRGLVSE
jgi:hypothetical protein